MFREQGAFLALSHPHKQHRFAETVTYPVIEGVEVWNVKYDGTRTARPNSLELYERLLRERPLSLRLPSRCRRELRQGLW